MFLRVLQTRLCFVAATASAATYTIIIIKSSLYCHSLLAPFAMNCQVHIIKKPVILFIDTRFICQVHIKSCTRVQCLVKYC